MAVAALVFSVLVGVMEGRGARRAEQRLFARTFAVLHRLPTHGYRRIRSSVAGRVLHYMGLFSGFLAVAYVLVILLRLLRRVLAHRF
jgi:hypothetical protein